LAAAIFLRRTLFGPRRLAVLLLPALVFFTGPAWGQDFGAGWADRVSRQIEQRRQERTLSPVLLRLEGGEIYYFDSNLHLESSDLDSDSILLTYVTARLEHETTLWHVLLDGTIDYKAYLDHPELSDDEERFFGRIRYEGARFMAEGVAVFRRESDPLDAVFLERVERWVSDNRLTLAAAISPRVYVEGVFQSKVVVFEERPFEKIDNVENRASLAAGWKGLQGMELFVDAGLFWIRYLEAGAQPNVQGWFAHAGVRREPSARLEMGAALGYTTARSQDFLDTYRFAREETVDASAYAHYRATQTAALAATYVRRIGFASGTPLQTNDTLSLRLEWESTETLTCFLSLAYHHLLDSDSRDRSFVALSISAEQRLGPHITVHVGGSYRSGDALRGGIFEDWIGRVGLSGSW
jgi:hypothetical protein